MAVTGQLVLEDGSVFAGEAFGARGVSLGEVVFNTGMTGYQEVLTDPSYCGQMVTMTYPLVGNYGTSASAGESARPQVAGFIVHDACPAPSHWQSDTSLEAYLWRHGICGLAGVDTRALTRHLRAAGTLRGAIVSASPDAVDTDAVLAAVRAWRLEDPVPRVTTPQPYRIFGGGPRIAVLDLGVKQNILRCLAQYDADITVLPAHTPAGAILDLEPGGVVLSNGPGDPKDLRGVIATVRELLLGPQPVPIFGICLGHQVAALALGADTYKLKYGHRGANHPVKDLATGRVAVTSQNHGYAVAGDGLERLGLRVTHKNLNDGTVEGMVHKDLPLWCVQYHPEAAPGPEDSRDLFERFLDEVAESARQSRAQTAPTLRAAAG